MAYPYPPYMQAHPPPGYGVPGSTGYFTTQHLGGFYAPISNHPPFNTAQPQAQLLGSTGSGGPMFNSWPGAPSEQEQEQEQEQEKIKAKELEKSRRAPSHGRDHDSKHEQRNRDGGHQTKTKKTHKKGHALMPWEQVVESLGEDTATSGSDKGDDHDGDHDGDHDDDDGTSYDHCDCSGSEDCSASSQTGNSEGGGDDDIQEIVIQPGGSAHVVVHLRRLDHPPSTATFVVSARCMHAMARGWPHVCHQGTNDYETTATDEAAALGMYWLLQVLHMGVEQYDYQRAVASEQAGHTGHTGQTGHTGRLGPGMAPATTPRANPPTIPSELPARVLAYATMFAHHFGVLDGGPADPNKMPPQMLQGQMDNNGGQASPIGGPVVPARFRARAETWMRAVTNNPRCRRTLDGVIVQPADWPFVLYTARVLNDRQLFAVCLRTLLERWWLNERGVFCDMNGPARIDTLPESMRETVLRDLSKSSLHPLPYINNASTNML
jgi:hypothetical protein